MRKTYILICLTAIVASAALTTIEAADPYVCGDADASGGIDIDDVVFLVNHIFAGGPAPDSGCCGVECGSPVIDYDGNVYLTVKIGDQCWMAQNLKVTHYRNGDPIPNVTDDYTWCIQSTGAYCNYDNDPGNAEPYGRLYNWYAVDDSRGIAPEGWHVPTDDEWKQLEMYLGMSQAEADAMGTRGTDEGGKLKEAGTVHWDPPNTGGTNESGFTALPGGYRWSENGIFTTMGSGAVFWCSTEAFGSNAWYRGLSYDHSKVYRNDNDIRLGFSVRCVRD